MYMADVARGVGTEQITRQDGEYWALAGTVVEPQPQQEMEALVEREQATVADPMPLGLAGFASAAFTISAVFAGWFGASFVFMIACGRDVGPFLSGAPSSPCLDARFSLAACAHRSLPG